MANCSMCGAEIPDGQRICSMCYGDPDYGKDGYYREYLNRQQEQKQIEQERAEDEDS